MGTDKAQLPIGRESMLQRIVRSLGSVVSPVVIAAARDQLLPDLVGDCIVVHDELPNCGPLEGIRIGLAHLPADKEYAYVSGCDTPLLKASFVMELLSRRGDAELIIPRDGDTWYPLNAVYHRDIVRRIRELTRERPVGPIALIHQVRTLSVDVGQLRAVDPRLDSLRNVNTPGDYRDLPPVNDAVE